MKSWNFRVMDCTSMNQCHIYISFWKMIPISALLKVLTQKSICRQNKIKQTKENWTRRRPYWSHNTSYFFKLVTDKLLTNSALLHYILFSFFLWNHKFMDYLMWESIFLCFPSQKIQGCFIMKKMVGMLKAGFLNWCLFFLN